MVVNLLAAASSIPSRTAGGILPISVPITPQVAVLASANLTLPNDSPLNNRVELNATIGIAAILNIPQVIFRLYRDGTQIFASQQGLQNAAEQFYVIRLITADFNVPPGTHIYSLSVEVTSQNEPAAVAGPITLSALAFGPVPN